jgi:hypothetical protein
MEDKDVADRRLVNRSEWNEGKSNESSYRGAGERVGPPSAPSAVVVQPLAPPLGRSAVQSAFVVSFARPHLPLFVLPL